MSAERADPLPPEVELALAWSGAKVRGPLSIGFQLDRRLARIVGRTNEVMLGQMRLAWWREALGKPVGQRPVGDAVLDGIGRHWQGREAALVQMVDAWEILVTADRIGPDEAARFGAGRGAFLAALVPDDADAVLVGRLVATGRCWALADAAVAVSDPAERAIFTEAGVAASAGAGRLGGPWRGVAVLGALSARSLAGTGQPLMQGRGASLTALRAAIFGA